MRGKPIALILLLAFACTASPVIRIDAASLKVKASNAWIFSQSEPAVLTVADPMPIHIVSQPKDQSSLIAEPLTFTVIVGGDTPYYYQWLKDGLHLPGATNQTLTLAKPHFPDAGVYSITVSNEFSVATGDPFTLEIRRHPQGELGFLHQDFVADFEPSRILFRGMTRQKDGRILLGAGFSSINGIGLHNLARLSQDGVVDDSFRPEVDGRPWIIYEESNGNLLVGGGFTGINGKSATNLARLYPDGRVEFGWIFYRV